MPTIPDGASVVRKRYRMRKTLRVGVLVLGMIYLIGTLLEVMGGLRFGRSLDNVLWQTLSMSGFLLGAGVLAFFETPLVRWLVPAPKAGCPWCGHASLPERGAVCSECGRELPPALLGGA